MPFLALYCLVFLSLSSYKCSMLRSILWSWGWTTVNWGNGWRHGYYMQYCQCWMNWRLHAHGYWHLPLTDACVAWTLTMVATLRLWVYSLLSSFVAFLVMLSILSCIRWVWAFTILAIVPCACRLVIATFIQSSACMQLVSLLSCPLSNS